MRWRAQPRGSLRKAGADGGSNATIRSSHSPLPMARRHTVGEHLVVPGTGAEHLVREVIKASEAVFGPWWKEQPKKLLFT